jgi:hypothetical protein
MKLFYTGPLINAEMLVVMLEKHGIRGEYRALQGAKIDPDDLNGVTEVHVPEEDYARAHQLFYVGREDEL